MNKQGTELVRFAAEQVIKCLVDAKTGKEYDPSWCRPKSMTKGQITDACEQAYHWAHEILRIIDNPKHHETQA